MPSLGSIIQIARTGLAVQQKAMNVAAHNIANASTPGYSRQRAAIASNPTLREPDGSFGTGAHIQNVESIRDALLDGVYYRELGGATGQEAHASIVSRIEDLLGEPSEEGLAASMDRFYSAWSELGSTPNSTTARSVTRQLSTGLVQKFQALAGGIDTIRQEVETRAQVAIERVGTLSTAITRLNTEIVATEGGGKTAGDLRDARTRSLTELATLVPISVTERLNGSVGVNSSGIAIIDGAYALDLEIRDSGGNYGVAIVGRAGLLADVGGTVGGLLEVLNTDHPDALQRLDDLANAFVTEVNALHTTGTNPDGNTGVDFFDAAGTGASTIALSAAVIASADAIAAGTPDGGGAHRAGANDVALGIAALRDLDVGSLGSTMGQHYQALVSDVGQAVRSSSESAEVSRVLSDQADLRRMQLSGVSLDEELVSIIEFQTAYQASARVLTAANDMIQTLLTI